MVADMAADMEVHMVVDKVANIKEEEKNIVDVCTKTELMYARKRILCMHENKVDVCTKKNFYVCTKTTLMYSQ